MHNAILNAFELGLADGVDNCIASLEESLGALRESPYHEALGQDFLHQVDAAAHYIIEFHRHASAKIKVAALYFEMNDFAINTDRWYCEGFAYKIAGDVIEIEWLAHWDCHSKKQLMLTGMESLQSIFGELYCDENQPLSVQLAADLAEHLVTARFMQLIAAAYELAKGELKSVTEVPILATAHDWDTVYSSDW